MDKLAFLLILLTATSPFIAFSREISKFHTLKIPQNQNLKLNDPQIASPGDPNSFSFCQEIPDRPIYVGNLIRNPDFVNGTDGWSSFGSSTTTSASVADIGYGIAKNRIATYSSISQAVVLAPGSYEYMAWVKLGSGTNQLVRVTGKTWKNEYKCIAAAMVKSDCWTKVVGGFTIEDVVGGQVTLYVEGPSIDVDLYLASPSLTYVDPMAWRKAQNERIEKLRKRAVRIQVSNSSSNVSVGLHSVRITQIESAFPFGGGLNGAMLINRRFRKWFKSRFNWAVFQNEAKWYYTEYRQNSINYKDADRMLEWCIANNITVRGHNVFWEVEKYVQNWVKELNDVQLRAAMEKRLNDVVSRYKGKFAHWDVNNEMLHGHYYSDRLGPDIRTWMYNRTREIDPEAKLFVNDFNVVEECGDTVAMPETYLQQIRSIQQAGGKIDAIGVESHFVKPQAVRLKHDLDQLGVAGLPIWITELDVQEKDADKQADYLEAVMREAFSHPSVEGIVLWETVLRPCSEWNLYSSTVCDKKFVCEKCLVDLKWNDRPIGKRYSKLRKEWLTRFRRKLNKKRAIDFRGFFGKYKAEILINGRTIERYFDVPQGTSTLNVRITI